MSSSCRSDSSANNEGQQQQQQQQQRRVNKDDCAAASEISSNFRMPLHYPRYKRQDYETMAEWKLDCLLAEYGLPIMGDVDEKRRFAMGTFLWN